jgi:hypothetical protein
MTAINVLSYLPLLRIQSRRLHLLTSGLCHPRHQQQGLSVRNDDGPYVSLARCPTSTLVALYKQLSRAKDALRRSSDAISEQERLVQVLRANGRATERAEELLHSFKQAHAALTYYEQELELRIKDQPTVAGAETDGGLQIAYL